MPFVKLRVASRFVVPALVLVVGVACGPRRIQDSAEEQMCSQLLRCWYPGETGNQFSEAGAQWAGMANADNARNIRATYGSNGTCWQADPMTDQTVDGETIRERALVESCGETCACTIVELCQRKEAGEDVPSCGAPADPGAPVPAPCDPPQLGAACAMCGSGTEFPVCCDEATATPALGCDEP